MSATNKAIGFAVLAVLGINGVAYTVAYPNSPWIITAVSGTILGYVFATLYLRGER